MSNQRSEAAQFADEIREKFADERGSFDNFETQLALWEKLFRKAQGMAQHEERRLRETRQRTARRQIGHLSASTAIRVVDLAGGLIHLINGEHIHAAYVVARATVETAAVAPYMLKNMIPLLAKDKAERTDEVLRRLTVGVDPGLGYVGDDGSTTHPIPVSSLMKALYSQIDNAMEPDDDEPRGATMRRLYSMLSDHAHPNHSAMHLSAHIDDHGMSWDRSRGWTESALYDVVGPTYLAMWFGCQALEEVLLVANRHPLILEVKGI